MCARNSLVPGSLRIGLCADLMGLPQCGGGFGDVYKHKYQGREVAVKILRIYATTDLRKLTRVSHDNPPNSGHTLGFWKTLHHPNVVPLLGVIMTGTRFAMVSEWMTNGNINQFVKAHQEVNRFELVRPRSGSCNSCLSLTGVACVVGRRREGLDLYARPRDGPRGS